MNSLSAAAILAKNSISDTGVWLILLDIVVGGNNIRICYNNENITWNGNEYVAFPFEIDVISENSAGELPAVRLRVSNVTRAMQYYISESGGMVGATVTLRVVHSKHLDLTTPEVEEVWAVTKCTSDVNWVTFTLGADYPVNARRPLWRFLKNFCPFEYKGVECGSTSGLATCNHSLADCRARGNSVRFGGEPAIPQGGLYATL